MNRLIFIIIIISAFTSCFREDSLLLPYQPDPEVKKATIPLAEQDAKAGGVVFKNQVFFELETGLTRIVKRGSWDLGFEIGTKEYHVMLNGANYMQAANAGLAAFGTAWQEAEMDNYTFDFDASSGNLDSTIIGEWLDLESGLSKGEVFFINRGFNGSLEERARRPAVKSLLNLASMSAR